MKPLALPIDPLLPSLCDALVGRRGARGALVLEAEPGAGKTTRVPSALLDALRADGDDREILVAEPRRIAARLAAKRVAEERGTPLGEEVGYNVRFEDVGGPKTRLRFVTDGVLLRRLLTEPTLPGVAAVMLDELHERHLATDVSLALLAQLRRTSRPDLALIATSATLDAEPVAAYLGCERLRVEGRAFPLTLHHLDAADDRPLEKQVASAVRAVALGAEWGDVLVFLPGEAEIRRAAEALEPLAAQAQLEVLPLYGDLPLEQQARAIAPSGRKRVVLSTNVAESSVTIEGVSVVIDAGLARVATHSPWTGMPRLELAKISQASAKQRAGRAGRTRAGAVYRLYTRGDLAARPAFDAPEIARLDLAEARLSLLAALGDAGRTLPFLTPPPAAAVDAADALLTRLGALDGAGHVTDIGRRMLTIPAHPRAARLLIEGERRGVGQDAAVLAAMLGERDLRVRERGPGRRAHDGSGPSDLLELLELFREAEERRFGAGALRSIGLDGRAVQAVEQTRRQLRPRRGGEPPKNPEEHERALLRSVLAAFPDRVARRRAPRSRELVLARGGTAKLSDDSVVHEASLLVVASVEERLGHGPRETLVRWASAIDPEWLLEDYEADVTLSDELAWNGDRGRVELRSRMSYGSVLLDETVTAAPPSPAAAELLIRSARAAGKLDVEQAQTAANRLALAAQQLGEHGFAPIGDGSLDALVSAAANGLTTLAALDAVDLGDLVLGALTPHQRALLDRELPLHVQLPGGRRCPVHYEPDRPPWIESRLQDFFGMADSPRIAAGRLPLTVQLLAPNQRAVQVTRDLAGFWLNHYPAIRRELMRRYPRHSWPEDGRSAAPPAPRR